MKSTFFPLFSFLIFFAILPLTRSVHPLEAAITTTGNVEPSGTWTNSTKAYVGRTSDGDLTVDAGSLLYSSYAYIAYQSGVTGSATVSDAGSKWSNNVDFIVGNSGGGQLTIKAGGQVSNSSGYLGYNAGSTGEVTVSGAGSTWTNKSSLYVGNSGTGTLTIEAGGQVSSGDGYVGNGLGSIGTITITGIGSKWTNSGVLDIGSYGSASLTVTDGGAVTSQMVYTSLGSLHGNGTISATQGAILDADIRFDATHGTQQTFVFGSGGTLAVTFYGGDIGAGYRESGTLMVADGASITGYRGCLGMYSGSVGTATVTGAASKWTNSSALYIGCFGRGELKIEGGGQVKNADGFVGYDSDATGSVTVTGSGSSWTNSATLRVGAVGGGMLTVEAGGQVSSYHGYVADSLGSSGTVIVCGTASMWTNTSTLYVGNEGNGILTIEAGGKVNGKDNWIGQFGNSKGTVAVIGTDSAWNNTGYLSIAGTGGSALHIRGGGSVTANLVSVTNTFSSFTIDVGYGSLISAGGGTGTFSNNGTVRILAGLQPSAGSQISPISATTWSGSGTYQAVGGTWDASLHLFTVSPKLAGTSGTPVAIDPAYQQRVLIEDIASQETLGASFLAKSAAGFPINFTATPLDGNGLSSLQGVLPRGESVLSGWNLTAAGTGYNSADPVYLSLHIPASYNRDDLHLWQFNGSTWISFSAADLSCNDGYASFTITGISGYAVTAVPEPSAIALLLTASLGGLLWWRWR